MSSASCVSFFYFLILSTTHLKADIIWNPNKFNIDPSCNPPRFGTCVNIWDCPFYETRLKQVPQPPYLLRKMRLNQCGLANSTTPKVCCRSTTTETKGLDQDGISNHEKHHLLPMDVCGPVSSGGRIVNGGSASPGEFPWMALIAYQTGDEADDQDFKCGGSLISESYVLTAAHCLDDKSVLGIRLGEYNISQEEECYNGKCDPPVQDILIDKIIIHPNYNPYNFVNDIALVRLTTPANMQNENVKPICLPTGDLIKTNLLGKFLTVTGWGTTETGHKSMTLNKVSIPVVPMKECRKVFGKFAPLTTNQVCAGGYRGGDSCSGDSGGPLQYIAKVGHNQRYVIDGIVSYGSKQCGLDGWPAVYTNVKRYMAWILDNLEQ